MPHWIKDLRILLHSLDPAVKVWVAAFVGGIQHVVVYRPEINNASHSTVFIEDVQRDVVAPEDEGFRVVANNALHCFPWCQLGIGLQFGIDTPEKLRLHGIGQPDARVAFDEPNLVSPDWIASGMSFLS